MDDDNINKSNGIVDEEKNIFLKGVKLVCKNFHIVSTERSNVTGGDFVIKLFQKKKKILSTHKVTLSKE